MFNKNIKSMWSDAETVTYLKLIYETNINDIYPSHFPHCLLNFTYIYSKQACVLTHKLCLETYYGNLLNFDPSSLLFA